jgi:parallel beta-helix repeat protein
VEVERGRGPVPGNRIAHLTRLRCPAAALVTAVVVGACLTLAACSGGQGGESHSGAARARAAGGVVCGQSVLRSPYDYDGAPGPYLSGTAGLPTYGKPGSDFPADTAGDVLAADGRSYASYQLQPETVYYLLPGTHTGSFMANTNDAFVGGRDGNRTTILSGGYSDEHSAIDSNYSDGDQIGVIIEFLTIEKFTPNTNAAAINTDANTGWVIRFNTITLNVPGAGIMAGAQNVISNNCLTLNGQYGFQSTAVDPWGRDSLTDGPYDVTVEHNEISYNDTCDYEGLLDNPAIGWRNFNPVPAQYRNARCGAVVPDGDQGGFKLWRTDGVTIRDNYIHNNWGPGAWVDTNNANTEFTDNNFTANDGAAIIEEISYNFSITDNYLADNDWVDGLGNPTFPQPAIYVANSGSDEISGSVPRCTEAACAGQGAFPARSVISANTMVDNGGSVLLFQNSNRYCSDGSDAVCTLADGASGGPFTLAACATGLRSAAVNTTTYVGEQSGSPGPDWWDGCQWQTANVTVTHNLIDFNPARIKDCTMQDWEACGAGGVFAEYGSPPNHEPGWVVPTQVTFYRHNVWVANVYEGPSAFYAWNQGNGDNPVSWSEWTGAVISAGGDRCSSSSERQSGYCTGPFGQDAGSRYDPNPPARNPRPPGL